MKKVLTEDILSPLKTKIADEYVPKTRTVNGKSLNEDISLTAANVSALPTIGGVMTGAIQGMVTTSAQTAVGNTAMYGKTASTTSHIKIQRTAANGVSGNAQLCFSNETDTKANPTNRCRLSGVATPTADSDATPKDYVDTTLGSYLPLSGGTMTGSITFPKYSTAGPQADTSGTLRFASPTKLTNPLLMIGKINGSNGTKIGIGLGTATDTTASGWRTIVRGVDTPTDDYDATPKDYVDGLITGLENTYVPLTRTVNGKALSTDISLTASNVGALPTSGGTMTGDIYMPLSGAAAVAVDGYNYIGCKTVNSTTGHIKIGKSGTRVGIGFGNSDNTNFRCRLSGVATPTGVSDAVPKDYVDGLSPVLGYKYATNLSITAGSKVEVLSIDARVGTIYGCMLDGTSSATSGSVTFYIAISSNNYVQVCTCRLSASSYFTLDSANWIFPYSKTVRNPQGTTVKLYADCSSNLSISRIGVVLLGVAGV